jgi:hypothetical protein
MSYFHDYEKLRTVRKSLLIGSIWEIIERTWYDDASNGVGGKVCIKRHTLNGVQYSYVYDGIAHGDQFYRDKDTFLRTFKPLVVDLATYVSTFHD